MDGQRGPRDANRCEHVTRPWESRPTRGARVARAGGVREGSGAPWGAGAAWEGLQGRAQGTSHGRGERGRAVTLSHLRLATTGEIHHTRTHSSRACGVSTKPLTTM